MGKVNEKDDKKLLGQPANAILNLAKECVGSAIVLKVIVELLIEKGIITKDEYEQKLDEVREKETEKVAEEIRDRLLVENYEE